MSNTPCAYAVGSVLHQRVEIKANSCHLNLHWHPLRKLKKRPHMAVLKGSYNLLLNNHQGKWIYIGLKCYKNTY